MTRLIFGGIIALLLLGMYAYAISQGIATAYGKTTYPPTLNEGLRTILSLVGGLVAALVIAELAVTPPQASVSARLADDNQAPEKPVRVIVILFLSVWVIAGAAALIVGYVIHPDKCPPLTEAGKAWLGLAVAAAYSYLGVKPKA